MQLKSHIMDESSLRRSMTRITHEIIEKNNGISGLVLLGIYRRGMTLARMLQENIVRFEGLTVPLGGIPITLYRDDLTEVGEMPEAGPAEIPCDLTGKSVILVDDVLYTGRTAITAIRTVLQAGRPNSVQLAVLIDRGHRKFPIRPDYVGKNIPTSHREFISVMVDEYDGKTGVSLCQM